MPVNRLFSRASWLLAITLVLPLCLMGAVASGQPSPVVGLIVLNDVAVPGAAVSVTITGPAGQFYALVGSSMGAGLAYGGRALAVGADVAILATGLLDSTGRVTLPVTPPFLLTTLDRYYLQAAVSPSPSFPTIDLSAGQCCATRT